MCYPIAFAVAGLAIAAASAAYTGVAQGQAAKATAKVQQQQATFDANRQREDAKRFLARSRVAAAASGTDLSGSSLDVLAQSAADAEIDALAIEWGGKQRSALLRSEGHNAMVGGFIGAGSTILNGASQFGSFGGSTTTSSPVKAPGAAPYGFAPMGA